MPPDFCCPRLPDIRPDIRPGPCSPVPRPRTKPRVGAFCADARSHTPRVSRTPNLPTKIIPTKIRRLKISGKFPMGLRIAPLGIKILLESNPLKPRILVRRLAAWPLCGLRAAPVARRSALPAPLGGGGFDFLYQRVDSKAQSSAPAKCKRVLSPMGT